MKVSDPHLFFGKNDPNDPRLGEWFHTSTLSSPLAQGGVSIWGYADDEGITLNGGRPGAHLAPQAIRKALYKMTPPLHHKPTTFADLGDLETGAAPSLGERHVLAQKTLEHALQLGQRVICLGGGHDYGYPDAAGFLKWAEKNSSERPLVINFDAHLDVRPTDRGFHSGTPFRRLLEDFKDQFDFVEVGIQPQCNSVVHRQYAEEKDTVIWNLKDTTSPDFLKNFMAGPNLDSKRPVWISWDMDVFSSAFAPGCSQVFASGLTADLGLSLVQGLTKNASVAGLGIYETSPPLDVDDKTSRLAALLAYHFIFAKELS
jgi:formiminoglutamase